MKGLFGGSLFIDGFAGEREAAVERRAADDVLTDAQPVRVQVGVPNPGLQIACELRVCRRRPQEISPVAFQPDLGHEEVVIGGKIQRSDEENRELNQLAAHRTVAPGIYRDSVDYRICDLKLRLE